MPQDTPKPEPQSTLEERPRPSAVDSGGGQGGQDSSSAGQSGDRSGSSSPEIDAAKLQKQVADTEAWVKRLRDLKAEGTRLSQEQQGRQPARREPARSTDDGVPKSEEDRLVDVLNTGDDKRFISEMLSAAERRVLQRTVQERDDKALADRVSTIVGEHAPDVPLPLFWHYTEEAIAAAPNDTAKQIELAIRLSRRALKERDDRVAGRRTENEQNRQNAETLDRGGSGPRGTESDDDKGTMVDDIRSFQASRR